MLKLVQVKQIPQNINGLLFKRMSDMSGGEKQKVVICCTLNRNDFKIGILDEPFSAIDSVAINYRRFGILELISFSCLLIVLSK